MIYRFRVNGVPLYFTDNYLNSMLNHKICMFTTEGFSACLQLKLIFFFMNWQVTKEALTDLRCYYFGVELEIRYFISNVTHW